jgi:hypothetical protein
VEEIGDDPDERQKAVEERLAEQSGVKREIVKKQEKQFEQFVTKGENTAEGPKNTKEGSYNTKASPRDIPKVGGTKDSISGNAGERYKVKDLSLNLRQVKESGETGDPSSPCPSSSASPPSSSCSPTSSISCSSSPGTSPRLPSLPLNSFQFQRDWQVLKAQPDRFYQYFKVCALYLCHL